MCLGKLSIVRLAEFYLLTTTHSCGIRNNSPAGSPSGGLLHSRQVNKRTTLPPSPLHANNTACCVLESSSNNIREQETDRPTSKKLSTAASTWGREEVRFPAKPLVFDKPSEVLAEPQSVTAGFPAILVPYLSTLSSTLSKQLLSTIVLGLESSHSATHVLGRVIELHSTIDSGVLLCIVSLWTGTTVQTYWSKTYWSKTTLK